MKPPPPAPDQVLRTGAVNFAVCCSRSAKRFTGKAAIAGMRARFLRFAVSGRGSRQRLLAILNDDDRLLTVDCHREAINLPHICLAMKL